MPRNDTHASARVRQVDDTDVIAFLLSTEIIPLCLRTMEMGSELSKTVATFIVQKILLDNVRAARHMAGAGRVCPAVGPQAPGRLSSASVWLDHYFV